MKFSNIINVLLSVGLVIAAVHPVHGLTVAEQADAFYQRGLEAEKHEDYIAAGNCYALTLRVNPGHAESLARMAELEKRNVFGAEAKAKTIILPALEYNLSDADASRRETRFQDTLALLTRLTGLSFVLEMEGEPIKSHNLNLREVSVETALLTISDQSDLSVIYERNVIRLTPKGSLSKASAEAQTKLSQLKERFQTSLASVVEPRQENLKTLAASFETEFTALATAVTSNRDDVAAINAERSKVAYAVRSQLARDQPGSFSAGAEEWTLFDTKGAVTKPVDHNPAGYLDGKDLIQGSDYYFAAPQPVLDRIRAASTNDSISFDFYTTATDEGIKDTLVLESPKLTLVLPVVNPPIREWKQFTYRFVPSEGWKIGAIGKIGKKPATADEITQVLASATNLYIRGEWKTGPDAARLDNVFITSNEVSLNPSTPAVTSSPTTEKPSLTSVAPFAPDPPAATSAMPQKEVVPVAGLAISFRDWLATVKFEQRSGDSTLSLAGESWRVVQNKAGKTFLWPIVSIEAATRTITWQFPDGKVRSLQVAEGRDKAVQKDGAIFKVVALASAGTATRLTQLDEEFQAAGAATLNAAHQEVLTDLRKKYSAAVKRAQGEAESVGDQVRADVFQKEHARVQAGADLPEKDDPELLPALVKMRIVFREQSASAAKSHAVGMKPLLDRYDAELAALESTLSGKPADLAAVKAIRVQIEKLRRLPATSSGF